MKYLENKSYDSKREMELMEALEDIKNLNKRQAVIDPEDLLQNMIYEEEQEERMDEEEEAEIDKKYEEMKQQLLAQKNKQVDMVKKSEVVEVIPEEKDGSQVSKQKDEEKGIIKQQKPDWKKMLKESKGDFSKKKGKNSLSKKIIKTHVAKEGREAVSEE